MLPMDIEIYIFSLYILVISSITVFLIVIKNIESKEISKLSRAYYNRYFILGVFGWLFQWIKEYFNIKINLILPLVLFLIASCLLLIAIRGCNRIKELHRRITILVHIVIIIIVYLLDNDHQKTILLIVYSSVIYSYISYLSFKRAKLKQNIGYTIIGLATLFVVLLIPYQIFIMFTSHDLILIYNIYFLGSIVGFVLVGIGVLTSLLIAENKKHRNLALYDQLTGLYNRRGLDFSLNDLMKSMNPIENCISAINVDIDFFKKINDTYGHDAGDFVLQKISKTLQTDLRDDDICSRFGGEEFVIILPNTCKNYATAVAERIRADIEALELIYIDNKIKLTSSFGVATHCNEIDIDYLIKDADKALYLAKTEGRNKVCAAISE